MKTSSYINPKDDSVEQVKSDLRKRLYTLVHHYNDLHGRVAVRLTFIDEEDKDGQR